MIYGVNGASHNVSYVSGACEPPVIALVKNGLESRTGVIMTLGLMLMTASFFSSFFLVLLTLSNILSVRWDDPRADHPPLASRFTSHQQLIWSHSHSRAVLLDDP